MNSKNTKYKEWQKVLMAVISVIILLVVFDVSLGYISQYLYHHSKYGVFRRQQYCLKESTDDVIILGSSRALHHYVPSVFSDSLGLTCYNAGSDGMCIYYHYAILSSYFHRNSKPKLVIYEVMSSDYDVSNSATFSLTAALDRLAPHYGEYSEIDSLFMLKGWKEKLKLNSMSYKYNSKLVQLIKCNLLQSPDELGYEALYKTLDAGAQRPVNPSTKSNPEATKIHYLRKLIAECKSHGVPLVFVSSPYYTILDDEAMSRIMQIAKEYDVPFISYKDEKLFDNPLLFADNDHLNDEGAHLFSKHLAHNIRMLVNHNLANE